MSEIEYKSNENLEYIEFKRLKEFENLTAIFTLKSNGIGFRNKAKSGLDDKVRRTSTKDLAKVLNDKLKEKINKTTFSSDFIKSPEKDFILKNIVQLNQEHTDRILNITTFDDVSNDTYNINYLEKENIIERYNGKHNLKAEPYDAVMTNLTGIATVITTADCIPIMIYDPINNVISNVHSGWKGTVQEIGIKAIHNMKKNYSSKPENLIFCLGPNIKKDHFLVNDDVKQIYENKFKEIIKHYEIITPTEFSNEKGRQYEIDNTLLYKILLKQAGLLDKNIIDSGICTVCSSNEFHSRRVEGTDYEVNASVMMLS